MASSNADWKTRIATLRHEILSYKPGKAVPCDDERVVFPDKLVIGMIDLCGNTFDTVNDLRRALYGDVKASKIAVNGQTSTEKQEEYLTDSISVIDENYFDGDGRAMVQDLDGKVGCMVQLIDLMDLQYFKRFITMIKEVTGRAPVCALLPNEDIPKARNDLKQLGVTHIYKVFWPNRIHSDEEQFQWLDLLHGCLQEGDRALATDELNKIYKNPRCKSLYEETKKEARCEVERLQTQMEDERARAEKEKRSLAVEMKKKLESQQQQVDTLTKIVQEKEWNEKTLRQQVEELEQKLLTSGKQAQGGKSSSEDNSTGGLGSGDTLQAGEEPPDDEFAEILQKIADDLSDEAKIESLGGHLGIIQGDIQRALKTNMRFTQVTSDGTRHMLKQWRRGVSREDERMEFRKALHAAKLVIIADLYLSKGDMTSEPGGLYRWK